MKINVRLFAQARDLVGSDQVALQLPDQATVAELRTELAAQYPDLAPLAAHLLIAVGVDYADDVAPLNAEDDVACFPPVSGG